MRRADLIEKPTRRGVPNKDKGSLHDFQRE